MFVFRFVSISLVVERNITTTTTTTTTTSTTFIITVITAVITTVINTVISLLLSPLLLLSFFSVSMATVNNSNKKIIEKGRFSSNYVYVHTYICVRMCEYAYVCVRAYVFVCVCVGKKRKEKRDKYK